MKIQKFYVGYCVAIWLLWATTLLAVELNAAGFALHSVVSLFSWISFLTALSPAHWILLIAALCSVLRNPKPKQIFFNIISIFVNCLGSALMFILHLGLIG